MKTLLKFMAISDAAERGVWGSLINMDRRFTIIPQAVLAK